MTDFSDEMNRRLHDIRSRFRKPLTVVAKANESAENRHMNAWLRHEARRDEVESDGTVKQETE